MEKFDLCCDLKDVMSVSELDSNTITYRINNFIYACNINIEDGVYKSIVNGDAYKTARKELDNEDYITVSFLNNDTRKDNKSFILEGKVNDLTFAFINNYDSNVMKEDVKELPFNISITKNYNECEYSLKMESVDKIKVTFKISRKHNKNPELNSQQSFHANILDFSKILRIVKAFNDNPQRLFKASEDIFYNEIAARFTNTQINKLGVRDKELDKPLSKIKKKIKFLLNND